MIIMTMRRVVPTPSPTVLFQIMLVFNLVVQPKLQLLHSVSFDHHPRLSKYENISVLLVFGDSSVDPGNNNRLQTGDKSNFPPYGKDFINGRPTGRFSNGRLVTDFIAQELGGKKAMLGFLDQNYTTSELMHGANFASAGSGFDDLTANLSSVLTISSQLNYFLHYKLHLTQHIGRKKAEDFIRKAVFVLSMGSNDFLQNYFLEPMRPKQFTLDKYQDYLIYKANRHIQALSKLGARRLVVVGVPNLGCMPIVKTFAGGGNESLLDDHGCVDMVNKAAFGFNSKMRRNIMNYSTTMKTQIKIVFIDAYGTIQRVIANPQHYGFKETSKGCCGTGTYEYGDTCKGLTTCNNPQEYLYWDAIHPTQKMYKILANHIVHSFPPDFFLL